jgi:hypothetical protein
MTQDFADRSVRRARGEGHRFVVSGLHDHG